MAFYDTNSNGFYMPVAPASYGAGYGNGGGFGGFGGDYAWLLLFMILIGAGGWGMGGFGGGMMWPMMMGGMGAGFGLDYLYPWLNNSQHISDGFRDQNLNTQIGDLRSDVNRGFGDVQLGQAQINQNICQTGNTITGAVRDGFYGAEIAANGRAMTNMQQLFGVQSAITDGACKQAASAADLKFTIANEGCADRAALSTAVNSLLTHIDQKVQGVQDKLCQLEMDGYKRENANLRDQLNMATLRESQTAQNAFIQQGFSNEVDALYNRLSSCPVPSTPVYGRTPIFTCQNNNNCCCGGGFAA
jgi:hypothetical protein